MNSHYQAMSNYFAKENEKKQAQKEELSNFRNEVMADPEKFADALIKNINKAKEKNPYGIGQPFQTITYTNNQEITEKMHGKELIQMIENIQAEAQGVYTRNVSQAHWSLVAKEQVDKAKATYQSCERAIQKLKKVL